MMTVRRVVVDHVDLLVRDLEASRRFYQAILEPLSYGIMAESDTSVSFGVAGADDFGINHSDTPTSQAHVAFVSPSRAAVDAFYANARAAAGRRGPPHAAACIRTASFAMLHSTIGIRGRGERRDPSWLPARIILL